MMTTVPLRVERAVFSDSLSVLLRARWIGMTTLRVGISKPIANASKVAYQPGTIETAPELKSFLKTFINRR